jgi:hypothetical protein
MHHNIIEVSPANIFLGEAITSMIKCERQQKHGIDYISERDAYHTRQLFHHMLVLLCKDLLSIFI